MSGILELLSPEEKSFLKAATKSIYGPAADAGTLFNYNKPARTKNHFPSIDYTDRQASSVLHDIFGMLFSQIQEVIGNKGKLAAA